VKTNNKILYKLFELWKGKRGPPTPRHRLINQHNQHNQQHYKHEDDQKTIPKEVNQWNF
jgi:hypothetical protein